MAQSEFARNDVPAAVVIQVGHRLANDNGMRPGVDHPDDAHLKPRRAGALALDLSEATPTFLPEFLRAVSKQAAQMAHDPFNALDNNPFITREWQVVSQVLHAAAASMEQRFEALFLGL
jgi:hypothetical protein